MLSARKKLTILRALWNYALHYGLSPAADHQAQDILSHAYEQLAQLWHLDVYGHTW